MISNQQAKLIFSIRARAKPRPIRGKWSMYLPQTYMDWCELVRMQAREQLKAQDWHLVESGAVLLHVKILQKKWRGDSDQLIGAIMDALQDAVYLDDCQVQSPMVVTSIFEKDLIIVTVEQPQRLLEGIREWVRQGEVRQKGARKGRAKQKLKGAKKCTISKRELLYQRHTSLT